MKFSHGMAWRADQNPTIIQTSDLEWNGGAVTSKRIPRTAILKSEPTYQFRQSFAETNKGSRKKEGEEQERTEWNMKGKESMMEKEQGKEKQTIEEGGS